MATASDLIKRSLRLLKVKESGESLTADEEADGLEALNGMLSSWSNQGLMQHGRTQISHTLTANDGTYTIGATGDIVTTTPVTIESAFIRDSNNVDLEIELINDEQFASIPLKTNIASYPSFMYFNRQFPNATINLYPIPSIAYTLYHNVIPQLANYTDGSDTVSLPEGYEDAIVYNLALRIAPEYKMPDTFGQTKELAVETMKWLKTVNGVNTPILNSEVVGISRSGRFNVFTGLRYW